jgi:hypothetical protein
MLHGAIFWKSVIVNGICLSTQRCRTAWTKSKLLKRFIPPYACFNHISSSPCEIAFVLGFVGEVMSRRVGEGRVCALSNLTARAFSFCLAASEVLTAHTQVYHQAQRTAIATATQNFVSVLISASYLGFLSPHGSTAGHAVNSVISASCVSLTCVFLAQISLPKSRTVPHRDSCNRHAANT